MIALFGHLPVPCYDWDGENRGVETLGWTDPAAWHFVLLGAPQQRDIDRGPFSDAPEHRHQASAMGAPVLDSPRVAAPDFDTGLITAVVEALLCGGGSGTMSGDDGFVDAVSYFYALNAPHGWRLRLCLMRN
jgi:hypothetical protein